MSKILTPQELRKSAPAAFATEPSKLVSDKYNFVPTISLIDEMAKHNFYPVEAVQSNTSVKENQGYQRHMIKFMFEDDIGANRDAMQYVLVNGHNARTSLKSYWGQLVKICSNGLVFGTIEDSFKIVHLKSYVDQIRSNIERMFARMHETNKIIKKTKTIQLTEVEKNKFAMYAHKLRYDKNSLVKPYDLLQTRREENERDDLWNVYNVLQENLVEGGVVFEMFNGSTKYPNKTKGVYQIDRRIAINVGLWNMVLKKIK